MNYPPEISFQTHKLLFIDSDNIMNERVLKAFLGRFGISKDFSKTQLSGFKPSIYRSVIEIPQHRIRIEAFFFSYNFLQLEPEEQLQALCKLIEEYSIDYIFSDYELNRLSVPNDTKEPAFYYSIKPGEYIPLHGNLLTGTDGIYARLGHRVRGKIHGIVLYGYMDNKQSYDIKKMKEEVEADIQRFAPAFAPPDVIIIDTSTYFTKANEEEFYIDKDNLRIKASARIRQEYSDMVGYLTFEWFEALRQKNDKIKTNEGQILEKLFKPQDYFNTNNLEVAYYIKAVNGLNTSEWQIGSASFFINNFDNKKERFLVDVPFREYAPQITAYIEEKKLTSFFYDGFDPKKGNLVQNRYFYFEYTYDYKAIQINLTMQPVSNFEQNANKNQVDFNKLMLEYIPFAHSVVFYEPEAGKNLKGCKVVVQPNTIEPAPKRIQMLCILKQIDVLNYSGLLVTYVWKRAPENQEKQFNVENGVTRFYNYLFPLLQVRMRDLLLPVLQDYTLRFGRQSAVSRILSRNFSHHMGSHIHPRTKSNMLNERLRHLLGPVSAKKEQMYEFVNWMRDKYSDYATTRSEFVAAPFQSSKSVYFYHDLVLPIVENMLVMDNLAASEGIRYRDNYQNRLRIRFRYKGVEFKAVYRHSRTEAIHRTLPPEAAQICYPDFFPYFVDLSHTAPRLTYEEFYADKTIENREDLPDLLVSVPHEHAFFSVLENLIRNIAKHQKRELNSLSGGQPVNMEIMIDVNDDTEYSEYYYVDLYDNISRVDNAEDWELFKEKINTELIDKVTLATANQNLGILDMRTCATILAGQKEAIDDGKGSNTPPLEVFLRQGGLLTGHKIRHDEYFNWRDARINYRFKIQKARRICYIGNEVKPNENEQKKWASEGVYFFKNPDDFLQQNEKSPVTYVFSIIEEPVLTELIDEKKLDKLLFNLPFKTLVNPSGTAPSELLRSPGFRRRVQFTTAPIRPGLEPVNTLQDQCWKAWLNRFDMLEKTTLIVHRERSSPEWAKAVEAFNASQPPFRMVLDQPGLPHLEDFTLKTGNSYAMYDHHSEGIIPFISGGEKGRMQLISHQHSHLPYDITSHDFARIDSPRFPAHAGEPWVFPYKLLQAAMLRILIIDERFADYAYKPASGKIGQQFPYRHGKDQVRMNLRNFDLCWASNVFIASHVDFYGSYQQLNGDIQYDPKVDHTLTIKFDGKRLGSYTNFNRDEGKDRHIPYDFVIIHRTLLSERQWLNGHASMDFIKEIREHIPYVILESGGNNHIFNETVVNFISYSELSSYFNDKSVSKLSLVQRLTSLIT